MSKQLWPKHNPFSNIFQPYPTHNQHASIAFFRFPVTKPLELKARPGRQLLSFTKLRPANHFTVLPAGLHSSVIFGSWKFQEGNREKNKKTHRTSTFCEPSRPTCRCLATLSAAGWGTGWLPCSAAKLQQKQKAEKIGPHPAPNLFNLNTSTNSGSWSCELPLQLMAIWLTMPTYGKGWQRPQSRHCGNATHLLDACCSSPCYELLKRLTNAPPASPETAAEVLCCPVVLCFETRSSAGERMTKIVARSHCIMRQVMVYQASGVALTMLNADKCCILLRTLS